VIVGSGSLADSLATNFESNTLAKVKSSSIDRWLRETNLPLSGVHEGWSPVPGLPDRMLRLVSGSPDSRAIASEMFFRTAPVQSDTATGLSTFALIVDVNFEFVQTANLTGASRVPLMGLGDGIEMITEVLRATSELVSSLVLSVSAAETFCWFVSGQESLGTLMDLSQFDCLSGGAQVREVPFAIRWPLIESIWERHPERAVAKGLLSDLLLRSGYRNFESSLATM
jgi:hypothetical protein